MKNKLPNKLHALLALAIKDLRKAERSNRYKINMDAWHSPNHKCAICMAGAVMAFELKAPHDEQMFPFDFDENTERKLSAINRLRIGLVNIAFTDLGGSVDSYLSSGVFNRSIAEYPKTRAATRQRARFYDDMKKLQKDLKKANL